MNEIASEKFRKKMEGLDALCHSHAEDADGNPLLHRDDTVRGKRMPVHMMYKYGKPLISKDRKRAYTFNIEYCTDDPSVGIYYGAFGVVLNGTIEEAKEAFDNDWNAVRPIAAQALGNTFGNPYFNLLFRQTDNINDDTYWPFWVSLGEDEDIVEIAYRAVRILRRIYEAYLSGELDDVAFHPLKRHLKEPCYACTEKAFRQIGDNGRKGNVEDEVLRFFRWCEAEKILSRNKLYDMGWTITENSFTNFAFLIKGYFQEIHKRGIYAKDSVPWKAISSVLLKEDGFIVGEANLKILISQICEEGNNQKIDRYDTYVKEKLKNYFT